MSVQSGVARKVRVADVDRTRERLSWSKPSPQEIYLACWRASFCFVVGTVGTVGTVVGTVGELYSSHGHSI